MNLFWGIKLNIWKYLMWCLIQLQKRMTSISFIPIIYDLLTWVYIYMVYKDIHIKQTWGNLLKFTSNRNESASNSKYIWDFIKIYLLLIAHISERNNNRIKWILRLNILSRYVQPAIIHRLDCPWDCPAQYLKTSVR